jgi:hypothetical protein
MTQPRTYRPAVPDLGTGAVATGAVEMSAATLKFLDRLYNEVGINRATEQDILELAWRLERDASTQEPK